MRRLITLCTALPALALVLHPDSARGVDPRKVERAIMLSVEKYCSASAMLAKTATFTHDFEVVESA